MKELPGLEPGLQESEPCVLTNYTIAPNVKTYYFFRLFS